MATVNRLGNVEDRYFQLVRRYPLRPIRSDQELNEAVQAIQNNRPSALLDGSLARDALVLCQKQTESIASGQPVAV